MFDHGDVYCSICDKTIHIRWESGNPRWMQRAMFLAGEAHKRESPGCKSTDLKITPYETASGPTIPPG